MAKIKFVLDKQVRKDGTNIVMLSFIHKGFRKQATLGVKVSPENWDAEKCLVSTKEKNHRHINQRLQFFRYASEGVILRHYGLKATERQSMQTSKLPFSRKRQTRKRRKRKQPIL